MFKGDPPLAARKRPEVSPSRVPDSRVGLAVGWADGLSQPSPPRGPWPALGTHPHLPATLGTQDRVSMLYFPQLHPNWALTVTDPRERPLGPGHWDWSRAVLNVSLVLGAWSVPPAHRQPAGPRGLSPELDGRPHGKCTLCLVHSWQQAAPPSLPVQHAGAGVHCDHPKAPVTLTVGSWPCPERPQSSEVRSGHGPLPHQGSYSERGVHSLCPWGTQEGHRCVQVPLPEPAVDVPCCFPDKDSLPPPSPHHVTGENGNIV